MARNEKKINRIEKKALQNKFYPLKSFLTIQKTGPNSGPKTKGANTMTNQLLAHCDTRRVDENAVLAVPSPDFTKSWRPVSHGQVIQTLEAACQYHGIAVRSREYSMSANGAKMFGVWELDITVDGTAFSLGVRNSIDKSFGIGITAGTKVFVCDNLCFSGDYIRFRKHTAGLDMDELTEIANEAVTGAVVKMERLYNWQDSLHNVFVPAPERKALVYDMVIGGVFSGGKIPAYLSALDDELAINHGRALDGAHNLYAMHGAATRLMRDWSLIKVAKATTALNAVCDQYLIDRAA
jgi:hypothetical protein